MKKIETPLSRISSEKQFPLRSVLPEMSMVTLLVYVAAIVGCNYYRVKPLEPLTHEAAMEQVRKAEKYLILHQGEQAWHFHNVSIDEVSQEMTGEIESLPADHFYYKTAKHKRPNRYKFDRDKNKSPTREVHIYTSVPAGEENSRITVPFATIDKLEVYDPDHLTSFASVLGITAAVGVVVVAFFLATKSSCPFVYIGNGDHYLFTGEMYGGAIYSSLERDDYMPLPALVPVNGQYCLKISNELSERQYTNVARLLVIDHQENIKPLLDRFGTVHIIADPKPPVEATSNSIDQREKIIVSDSNVYRFDEQAIDDPAVSNLILSFKKPPQIQSAKLVIRAKNSYWLDYVYGKFNEHFGTYYNTFAEAQKKVPAKKSNQWAMEQYIPLAVFVESKDGWSFVDYFNVMGPLASRDLVIPINLANVDGDKIRIKLECGFMFWEIDYAAMDFTENMPVEVASVVATSAIDENGKEVRSLLSATDEHYLIQPDIGNVVTLKYTAPEIKNARSVFLHSRGYYEYIRDYKNWPDFAALRSFKKKGAFTRFAKKQYDEFVNTEDILTSALTQRYGN